MSGAPDGRGEVVQRALLQVFVPGDIQLVSTEAPEPSQGRSVRPPSFLTPQRALVLLQQAQGGMQEKITKRRKPHTVMTIAQTQ